MIVNEVDVVAAGAAAAEAARRAGGVAAETGLKIAAAAWIYAGGAHHTGFSQALTTEHIEDFAEIAGIELLRIDADTEAAPVSPGAAMERRRNYVVLIPLTGWTKVSHFSRKTAQGMLEELKEVTLEANLELLRSGLVLHTFGNARTFASIARRRAQTKFLGCSFLVVSAYPD